MPDAVSLIQLKRDNIRPLTDAEIAWLFGAYAENVVADEQMAALLMAIYFNGLNAEELSAWSRVSPEAIISPVHALSSSALRPLK